MKYARIENQLVTNIIELNNSNASDFPDAIRLENNLPVTIGDGYVDGKFYRDGEMLVTELDKMQAEIEQYKAALQKLGVETEEVANDEN